MKTSKKCISCFFKQVEKTSSLLKLSKKKTKDAFCLVNKKLLRFDFYQPPVAFGRTIYKTVASAAGVKDPFLKEKAKIERYLLPLYSYIEKIIQGSRDPFYKSAKLCSAANAIDFGAGNTPDIKKFISELARVKLKINHFPIFKDKLKKAKSILFIGDNCGEVFFDRFFIEQIKFYKPDTKVYYAARSAPIINDALVVDVKAVGIDKLAYVLSSGCDYPGLIFDKTSAKFKAIYKNADIVISKGQGNFESFADMNKDVFYIFKVKCLPVSEYLKLPLGSLLFSYNQNMV